MSDTQPQPPLANHPLDEVSGRTLVEAWRTSGLSVAAYCRQQGLRPQRLNYWRERLGYPIKVIGGNRRTTDDQPPTKVASGFVQVVVDDQEPTSDVTIVVGGAHIRVERGFDAPLLRAVVAALQPGS